MINLFRTIILILFLVSVTTFSYSETSWITKKSDKTKIEKKEEKKKKKKFIKFKKKLKKVKEKVVKKNKKLKKEDKELSTEVKTWITKKTKNKFIDSIDKLPDRAIYFVAFNNTNNEKFYGYTMPNQDSEMISNYYKISNGVAYSNDKKTTCNFSSEVLKVNSNSDGSKSLNGDLYGNCTDGKNFRGAYIQTMNSGNGFAMKDDRMLFTFIFSSEKKEISQVYDADKKTSLASMPEPKKKDIKVDPPGKYYALLIGNSKYIKWDSLKSPGNDVKEIGKILKKKYKFASVNIVENANRSSIFDALKKLRDEVSPNDYVLIYYSGHGQQDAQRGYWIPVNGEKDWDPEWIDSITVTAAIQRIKARHILLMVDSCYLGSSFKGDSKEIDLSEEEWNAEMANKALTYRAGLVLASGGSTPVTDAVIDDKHSMFAFKFIDILKKNNNFILSSEIASKLKKYHAKQSQTPQYYGVANWGHLEGDFVFVAKN